MPILLSPIMHNDSEQKRSNVFFTYESSPQQSAQ